MFSACVKCIFFVSVQDHENSNQSLGFRLHSQKKPPLKTENNKTKNKTLVNVGPEWLNVTVSCPRGSATNYPEYCSRSPQNRSKSLKIRLRMPQNRSKLARKLLKVAQWLHSICCDCCSVHVKEAFKRLNTKNTKHVQKPLLKRFKTLSVLNTKQR